MSHYKPYLAYKDSGVEWLGEVPESWDVKRLRFVAAPKNSNVDKKTYEGQFEIRLCNYTDVYYNETITPALDFMQSTASDSEIKAFSLLAGDVIITKDSETADDIGIPAYVPHELPGVVCGYHLTMLRSYGVNGEFLFRLLQTQLTKAYFFVEVSGVTRFGLGQETINNIVVPLPSCEEQRLLCQWMNRETARIDGLISKKTRFIELLREKRQALITHAVTKGLDPNVKMKDSGVEWLGEVPEHWEVKPIKYLTTHIGSGKTPSGGAEVYQDSGVLFLRSQNVHDDGLRLNDVANISEEIDQEMRGSRVLQGDALLNITGASIGRSCLVAKDIGPANVNQHVCIVRTAERELTRWISEYFLSTAIKAQIDFSQNGAGREGLNFEQIGNMIIALPPVAERRSICSMLMNNRDRLDTLISKTELSVELLKERRSALITAAVTGQIDVRGNNTRQDQLAA